MRLFPILLLVFFMVGCSMTEKKEIDPSIEAFLKEKGFEDLEYIEEKDVSFTKDDLNNDPWKPIWQLQDKKPDQYVGKKIKFITYTGLNKLLSDQSKGKTVIGIYLYNNKIIAATTFPYSKEPQIGMPFSIDGKTLEEIHGENLSEFQSSWEKRYK